ncbi:hypothetical protein KW496_11685 [Vibrio fluvialis]|nr:hypothetical protein [Vibrio fluvialis]
MTKSIEEEMADAERDIVKALLYSIPLMIVAVVAPIAAYNQLLLPLGENAGSWFQRSGAITLVFALWVEFNLIRVNEHINLSGITISDQTELSQKYKLVYRVFQYLGIFLAIVGTIICSYGDLATGLKVT